MGDGFLAIIKTRAVVLKTQDIKENDKIVWFFTEKVGKISTIVRGVKKSKSRFLSVTLPFCFGEYVFFKGKSMFSINEGGIIDSFQELLNDLESISYSSYFNELIDMSMVEGESNVNLFREYVTALYLLKNKVASSDTIARAFELKLLQNTGYTIDFNHCTKCGRRIISTNFISSQYYGGICKRCEKDNAIKISYESYSILKYINSLPLRDIHKVTLSEKVKEEIYKITYTFICQSYAKKPKSLEILNTIIKE